MKRMTMQLIGSILAVIVCTECTWAELLPPAGSTDPRVRQVAYRPDEVYRLKGFVGYSIHLVFAPGESFSGMGGGDVDGIAWDADGNHLFIKPKQPRVETNLTLITNLRAYELHYSASNLPADTPLNQITYSIRFTYEDQHDERRPSLNGRPTPAIDSIRNDDYWYCGDRSLQPIAVWDDGAKTWIRFGPQTEWPAIFALGADGEEAMVNYHVNDLTVVVHRVAPRFILRRGKLVGCVLNRGFAGAGIPAPTGTDSSSVIREIRGGSE